MAQRAIVLLLEPIYENDFRDSSYGYRRGRSAHNALQAIRSGITKNGGRWVLDVDVRKFFDQIDQGLLMKAVRTHISEDWILLYLERWLTAPFELEDGTRLPRTRGTPQGGVVSPILMNLFMHYAFDCWMQCSYPHCPFARYADDAVVHCRSLKQAQELMQTIASRLEECGLTMHPEKSKIVYCKDSDRRGAYPQVEFTFLSFTFRPRRAQSKRGRVFTSFLPAVSKDALKRMRQQVGSWKLQRQSSAKLVELAQQFNPVIRGWWNYYGAFYRRVMDRMAQIIDQKLELWARRKYKPLAGRYQCSAEWLGKMKQVFPGMFFHWRYEGYKVG